MRLVPTSWPARVPLPFLLGVSSAVVTHMGAGAHVCAHTLDPACTHLRLVLRCASSTVSTHRGPRRPREVSPVCPSQPRTRPPQPRPPSPVTSPAETWGASPEAAQNSSVRTTLRPASSGPLAWTPRDGPSVQTARGQPANWKRATVPIQLEAAGSVCSVRASGGLRRAEKTLPSSVL